MRDKDYRLSQMKYKLKELERRRVKSVIWRLTRQQREFIEKLGYEVVPYLYEVQVKTMKNLSAIKNPKIKEVHYSCKKGKRAIVMKLNSKDMKDFEEYGIKFRPIKFMIKIIS